MVNIISLELAGVMKQPNFGIQGAFEEDVIWTARVHQNPVELTSYHARLY